MLIVAEGHRLKAGGKFHGPGTEVAVGDALPEAQAKEYVALGVLRETKTAAKPDKPAKD